MEIYFKIESPYRIEDCKLYSDNIIKFIIPEWQRDLDERIVNRLLEYQLEFRNNHDTFNFIEPIKFGVYNNKYYLIDGQHRMQVIKKLSEKYKPFEIYIRLIYYDTLDEMKKEFINFHKSTPLDPIILQSCFSDKIDDIKYIRKYFITNYKNYIKGIDIRDDQISNIKIEDYICHKPHIHISILSEIIKRKWFKNRSGIELINYIENINNNLKIQFEDDPEYEKIREKIQNKRTGNKALYLSLDKYWYYDEDEKRDRIKVTKEQRTRVWELRLTNNCFSCNTIITPSTFECGHIISVYNGGLTCVKNLIPICGGCNKKIGKNNIVFN